MVRLSVCLSVARNSIVQVINYTYKIIRLKSQHEIWNGAERCAHCASRPKIYACRRMRAPQIGNGTHTPAKCEKVRGQCPGTSIELYNVFSFSPAAWCCRVRGIFYFLIGQKPRYLRAIFYWAIIFSFFLIKLCAVNMGVMSRQCQPCARRSTTKLINHREAPMKTRLARDLSDDDQLSSQFMRAR